MLANWRANLIGPECIRWKDKILYHSQEIEEWFETKNLGPEPDENPNAEPEPKKETEPAGETSSDEKSDSNEDQIPSSELEYEYLTPRDVSEKFQVSLSTLSNWRSLGTGPSYFKMGNKIRYANERLTKYFKKKNPDLDLEHEEAVKSYRTFEPDPKPEYLNDHLAAKELAEKYRLKTQTLANWRTQGRGPGYQKYGNKIYYPIPAIDKWIQHSRVRIHEDDDD